MINEEWFDICGITWHKKAVSSAIGSLWFIEMDNNCGGMNILKHIGGTSDNIVSQ